MDGVEAVPSVTMTTLRANRALRALPSLCSLRIGMEAGGSETLERLRRQAREALEHDGGSEQLNEDLLNDDAWLRAWGAMNTALAQMRAAVVEAQHAEDVARATALETGRTSTDQANSVQMAENMLAEAHANSATRHAAFARADQQFDDAHERVKRAWLDRWVESVRGERRAE